MCNDLDRCVHYILLCEKGGTGTIADASVVDTYKCNNQIAACSKDDFSTAAYVVIWLSSMIMMLLTGPLYFTITALLNASITRIYSEND